MKAKVIKTGEIVDVYYHGVPSYAVLDCNHRIKELYYEDDGEMVFLTLTDASPD